MPNEKLSLKDFQKVLEPMLKEVQVAMKAPEMEKASQSAGKLLDIAIHDFHFMDRDASDVDIKNFLSIVRIHPAYAKGNEWVPVHSTINQFKSDNDELSQLGLQTAALLLVGLKLAATAGGFREMTNYHEAMLAIALEGDDVSRLVRETLTKRMPDWKNPFGGKFPLFPLGMIPDCARELRGGFIKTGGWQLDNSQVLLPEINVKGITRLQPNSGSCDLPIVIHGNFPVVQPPRTYALFVNQFDDAASSPIDHWSSTAIHTRTPFKVGEGPVGIITFHGEVPNYNAGDVVQFAEVLSECLGASRLASGLAHHVSISRLGSPPKPTQLPGNENLFHGGPILRRVVTPEATSIETIEVEGLNLENGDRIVIDGQPCATAFASGQSLSCTVGNEMVRGGVREVLIKRGSCSSLSMSIRLNSVVSGIQSNRAVPGNNFLVNGTCFSDEDMTATINGERTQVVFVDAHTVAVRAIIPRRTPSTPNVNGEDCELIVFGRGVELARFPVTLEVYRIVSFGDSIMWGQGLLESQKFPMLVADGLMSVAKNDGMNTYALDRSANSGAAMLNKPGDPPDFNCGAAPSTFDVPGPGMPPNLEGEKNCGATSVAAQVAQWAVVPQEVRERIKLVLINGGINDFGVMNVLNPIQLNSTVVSQVSSLCSRMLPLLTSGAPVVPFPFSGPATDPPVTTTVLQTFPNAKIVVLGYYPIVSKDTDGFALMQLLMALGFVKVWPFTVALIEAIRQRLIETSKLFADTANSTLRAAVASVGDPRVKLAVPVWTPANSIFSSSPFVFGLQFPLTLEDPVAQERIALCGTPCLNPKLTGVNMPPFYCGLASLGHPNAAGARAYAEAIVRVV